MVQPKSQVNIQDISKMLGQASRASSTLQNEKFIYGHAVVSGLTGIKNESKKCFENLINVNMMGCTLKISVLRHALIDSFFNAP